MNQVAVSRMILLIMCASYLLSAVLLGWARLSGQTVPAWKIAGWAVTGIVAAALLPWLSADRLILSIAVFLLLWPWMAIALADDVRGKHFIIAVVDMAGLIAIGYAMWLLRKP